MAEAFSLRLPKESMKLIRAFMILAFFVALSAIHLAIYTNSIKIGYAMDELKGKLDKLRNENRYLNYLVAKEQSLPRIEGVAKSKLNMVYPDKVNYVVVPSREAGRSQ
jgi:cell division protein FtsL